MYRHLRWFSLFLILILLLGTVPGAGAQLPPDDVAALQASVGRPATPPFRVADFV